MDANLASQLESRQRLRRLARPLQLLSWGSLFALLDFQLALRVGARSVSFDVFPDVVGFGLAAAGMLLLAFGGCFEGALDAIASLVAAVFVAAFLGSATALFLPAIRDLAPWTQLVLRLVGGAAVVALCLCLRALCLALGLAVIARAWTVVAWLFVLFYSLPQAVWLSVPAAPGVLVGLPILSPLVPIAGFFVVIHRMKGVAEGRRERSPRLPGTT